MKLSLTLAAGVALAFAACAANETPIEGTPSIDDAGGGSPLPGDVDSGAPSSDADAGTPKVDSGTTEAVCGDDKLAADEECDDGNNTDADGCSKTCKIESAGTNDICPGQTITLAGTGEETRTGSVSGDTSTVYAQSTSSCGGATGPDAVYVVTPNVTGMLTARITSTFDSILYARRTCNGAGTEVACQDAPSTEGETISLGVTKDEPVYLFIDGYSGSSGTFTLDVTVATAFCGNGIAESPEVCDDNNTTSGDGCSSTCTFEAGGNIADCPGQPINLTGNGNAPRKLSLVGTTVGLPASTLLATGCSSSGPNAVYSITSDIDGSLTARLVTSYDAGSLHIRNECDTSSSDRLDCRAANDPFEPMEITVPVLAGFPTYVVVDSSSATNVGDYTLDVTVNAAGCGNKARDASEECDDGNLTNGDGCTATCTLEPTSAAADKCPGLELPLMAAAGGGYTAVVTSSTATMTSDYKPKISGDGCVTSTAAKDAVFKVTSPVNGRIRGTVTANFDAAIYARTWCADTSTETELACSGAFSTNAPEVIDVPIEANKPVYVIVDGETTGTGGEGVFELGVVVTPQVCGNGGIEFGEQCDDGNATSGDGCSATCSIEVATSHDTCANAEAITLTPAAGGTHTATIASGTTNLMHDQTFTGCPSLGPDAIYTVTAPIDGVLIAKVPSSSFNLSLGARTTCPPSTTSSLPITCSNKSSGNGLEEIALSVAQGETYYLIVDGVSATAKGSFTMSVEVKPPTCGDGFVSGAEECDDGNLTDGDGCSATCTVQPLPGFDTCPGAAVTLTGVAPNPRTVNVTLDTSTLAPNYAGTCGGASRDGVIVVTPPISGTLKATLTGINGFQPIMYARTNCTDATTEVACDDDNPNPATATREITISGVTAGTPYYLIIDSYGTASGKAQLNVTVTP